MCLFDVCLVWHTSYVQASVPKRPRPPVLPQRDHGDDVVVQAGRLSRERHHRGGRQESERFVMSVCVMFLIMGLVV